MSRWSWRGRLGRGGGLGEDWRLPAFGVAAVLVVLVLVARLGMSPPEPPRATVHPTGADLALDTPAVTVAPSPAPTSTPVGRLVIDSPIDILSPTGFMSAASTLVNRYGDGIPSWFRGEPVYRVNETLNLAARSATGNSGLVLIGGWYGAAIDMSPDCAAPPTQANCRTAKIADDPTQLDTDSVAVDGASASASGPVILRGAALARCAPPFGNRLVYLCLSAIHAREVVWTGDDVTQTQPMTVFGLMSGLAGAFDEFTPVPLEDPGCAEARPQQSFRSADGPIALIYVFSSPAAREAAQGHCWVAHPAAPVDLTSQGPRWLPDPRQRHPARCRLPGIQRQAGPVDPRRAGARVRRVQADADVRSPAVSLRWAADKRLISGARQDSRMTKSDKAERRKRRQREARSPRRLAGGEHPLLGPYVRPRRRRRPRRLKSSRRSNRCRANSTGRPSLRASCRCSNVCGHTRRRCQSAPRPSSPPA